MTAAHPEDATTAMPAAPKHPSAVTEGSVLHRRLLRRFANMTVPADDDKARDLAEAAHWGQTDHTGVAYILHPAGVVQQLITSPHYATLTAQQQQDARQAAWLHDVVEDTAVTLDDLRAAGFTPAVVATVEAVTHLPHEPRRDYYRRVKRAGAVALAVKLADLAHNTLPERRADLPGSPTRPLQDGEEDQWTKLGKKYLLAYTSLGVTPPAHLQPFARTSTT